MSKIITNLVIGSEGFIGKPFCEYLESLGEKVIHFDIKNGKNEDIRKVKLPLKNVDRVYFLAWDVGGAKYLFKQKYLMHQLDWNLKILMNTMPQLEKSGVPFFFLSSQFAEEYGTPYGATKRLGEIWTRLLPNGHYGRQWNAYGIVEEQDERSHVISDFIHQAITTGQIRMLSNGEEYRQFTHFNDSFRAYHHILSNKMQGGIYDITSGEWIKVVDLARFIAEHTDARVIVGKNKSLDHRKFPCNLKIPGWKPKVSLKEGLIEMIKNHRVKHSRR